MLKLSTNKRNKRIRLHRYERGFCLVYTI